MAAGSYFLILSETKNKLHSKDLKKYNLNKISFIDDLFEKNKTKEEKINSLQDTQKLILEYPSDSDYQECYDYYSVTTGQIYRKHAEISFLSDFLSLKEYFELNPYSKRGEIEISVFDAYKMLEALQYISNRDLWSSTLEATILNNNEYIKVFEVMSSSFFNRFKSDLDEIEDYEYDMVNIKRLIEALSTFLVIQKNSEDKIKLIYKTW